MDKKNKIIKIITILADRANYGRLKPVLELLRDDDDIESHIVCTGTMLLDKFGKSIDVVKKNGFFVGDEVYIELEGATPSTMSKSIGLGIIQLSNVYERLKPDFVLVIGDRYEALSAAIAAVYQNYCLIHVQGGEVTGSIDESTRHAITKLAHYHFPSTKRSEEYIVKMGEHKETVFAFGCPSIDIIRHSEKSFNKELLTNSKFGVGNGIDIEKPYLLVLFHPVTTEYIEAEQQMEELLKALKDSEQQIVIIWPNIDAGSNGISQAIRRFRENNHGVPLHAYKNFEPEDYIPILRNAACAVGNSSSFVRDASFIGTPVVLVGSRQDGREWCTSVKRVKPKRKEILDAINDQVRIGRYPVSDIYGEPGASQLIANKISELKPYSQKHLSYTKKPF
jgi:UDP-hydrolysing UDP-N-acetyl-D-glucosamine 2-epimerase